MAIHIRRREFIFALGGAAATWPVAARAQQPAMPIVGFVDGRSAEASVRQAAAFRKGLNETGYVEGQNVAVDYQWLNGQYDRLPALMADLVRRRVAVIAALSNPTALAAKAATSTIPIVFGVGQDPVRMGVVASLARPGGNATGINFFNQEAVAKEAPYAEGGIEFGRIARTAGRIDVVMQALCRGGHRRCRRCTRRPHTRSVSSTSEP
jgi:putative tryptophan/tyrosine transport system substrate-binding protein